MTDERREAWDVVVIGGGNAGIVSAIAARESGRSVLVLERASELMRGGNSRHTRNIRCVHNDSDKFSVGTYTEDEVWSDLCGVGTGPNNEALARLTVEQSESAPRWMTQHGAMWQAPLTGTLHLGRTNRFFLGGGKALLNRYYRTAASLGVVVRYESLVEELLFDGDRCAGLVVTSDGHRSELVAGSVVCAAGGYESNLDWLASSWGDAARNFHIRGPATNDGLILRQLFDGGAEAAGHDRGFHAVAVDARSPKFDGGIATRIDAIPYAIVLNADAKRFYDEGEEIWPKRYATWGGNIAAQRDQIAYAIWDRKSDGLFLPPMYGTYTADTVAELAVSMGLDGPAAAAEIARYNESLAGRTDNVRFDPQRLDGLTPHGLTPAKIELGPVDHRAAVLRRGDATGHHVHLPRRRRRRHGARAATRRRAIRQHLRRRRDHVGQHPLDRLHGGLRHDDRHRMGSNRWTRGSPPCCLTTSSPRGAANWPSATRAATARACARCGRPSSCAPR